MENRASDCSENDPDANDQTAELTLIGVHSDSEDGASYEKNVENERTLPSICGDFMLSHPSIALNYATEQVPAITVRPEHVAAAESATILVFSVHGDRLDEFEETLEQDETVLELMRISGSSDSRCYRATLSEDTLILNLLLTRIGARILEVAGSAGRWEIRSQFRSREAFLAFRNYCADNNINFRLHRLRADATGSDWQQSGLTPEQWDTLQRAYESGYFDVPRGVSQSELADEIGISPSAVSQRLRRAMNRLLQDQLDADDV